MAPKKPKQLYALTEDHRAQLAPWRDRWIANAMSTAPMSEADRVAMAGAVRGLYEAAGLEPPPANRIVFVPSPFVARFAGGFAAAIWYLRGRAATWAATTAATAAATWAATTAATRDATWDATWDATADATWDATSAATRAATKAATRDATRDATEAATWDAMRDATSAATRAATKAATRDATRDATEAATWAVTWAATSAATWAATAAATRDATGDATDAATWVATEAATRAATRDATTAATWDAMRDATSAATRAATKAATRDATRDATEAATRAVTWAATGDATEAATRAVTWAATGDATWAATEAATGAATRDATWDAAATATRDATMDAWFTGVSVISMRAMAAALVPDRPGLLLRCADQAWAMWDGGNQWSAEPAWLSFFRHVAQLPLDYSKWQHYEAACIHGGPRVMHKEFCIVSDRPLRLLVDDQNRPHCADGPFCAWRDGTALWAWHGVRVPAWVITNPEHITVQRIQQEQNAEVRRVLLERFGADRYISELGATPLDADGDWALFRAEVGSDEEPLVMVRVLNSTPEPDGSRKTYWLRVDPQLRPLPSGEWDDERKRAWLAKQKPQAMTARNAVASTFGLLGEDYRPAVET